MTPFKPIPLTREYLESALRYPFHYEVWHGLESLGDFKCVTWNKLMNTGMFNDSITTLSLKLDFLLNFLVEYDLDRRTYEETMGVIRKIQEGLHNDYSNELLCK